jgi:uncharacterized protein VirK/YbjX
MYLNPFLQMARRRFYWSPSRLGRIVWSLLTNLPRQIELFGILSLPVFKNLVSLDPVFAFKHLSTDYLFKGLSARDRAASFLHHYRFLKARLPERFLRQSLHHEIPLYELRNGDCVYTVTLGFPVQNAIFEGESRLELRVNGMQVYVLQFTVVPGRILQSSEKDVAFIQCLQGVKGRYQQVHSATKAFGDVAPPALLFSVLRGVATAWGIGEIAGISSRSHCRFSEASAELFQGAYDDFFTELGAARKSPDFFSIPLPFEAKPVEGIKNGHKSRTRKKRAFKLQIVDQVYRRMIDDSSAFSPEPHEVPFRELGAAAHPGAGSAS